MTKYYSCSALIFIFFNLLVKSVIASDAGCSADQFMCLNNKCISRSYFCDGDNDCGDNSDEKFCSNMDSCPSSFNMCPSIRKCISKKWWCDGVPDCTNNEDELNCEKDERQILKERLADKRIKVLSYLESNIGSGAKKFIPLIDKLAVSLYFASPAFYHKSETRQQMVYMLSNHILSRLAQKEIQHIPSSDLASYVHSMLVTCLDPRDFYGFNFVRELRNRVNSQNYTNPYVLLALCNAGDMITEMDKVKLNETFWSTRREVSTGTQALVVMALSCAKSQKGCEAKNSTLDMMKGLVEELQAQQYRNGTVKNLQVTALVMQALYAAESMEDPEKFDELKALNYILNSHNHSTGFFGNLKETYYVLPVLNFSSLVNISSSHCPDSQIDEDSAMYNLVNQPGAKMTIQYSLWIGMERDIERSLTMKVPVNTSIYGTMEIASQIDSRFKFEYVMMDRKPYITAVSGILDDYESGKFWFPYIIEDGKPIPVQKSTADVILKDGNHFALWYRTGTWED